MGSCYQLEMYIGRLHKRIEQNSGVWIFFNLKTHRLSKLFPLWQDNVLKDDPTFETNDFVILQFKNVQNGWVFNSYATNPLVNTIFKTMVYSKRPAIFINFNN